MTFEDYLKAVRGFSHEQFDAFRLIFADMTKDGPLPQFRQNVWNECRFDEPLWERVWGAIHNAHTYGPNDAPDELKHRVMMDFRKVRWQGGQAFLLPSYPIPPNTVFGRAMKRDELITKWSLILGLDAVTVENKVLKPAIRKGHNGPAELVKAFKHLPIWKHLMWSTFDKNNLSAGPFQHNLPPGKDGIACSLGLELSTEPLILIEYTLPPDNIPHIPTIANAYAGGDWQAFFRPQCYAPYPYGETFPNTAMPGGRSCPEVVHEPITAHNLVNSIRQI